MRISEYNIYNKNNSRRQIIIALKSFGFVAQMTSNWEIQLQFLCVWFLWPPLSQLQTWFHYMSVRLVCVFLPPSVCPSIWSVKLNCCIWLTLDRHLCVHYSITSIRTVCHRVSQSFEICDCVFFCFNHRNWNCKLVRVSEIVREMSCCLRTSEGFAFFPLNGTWSI